MGCSNIDEMHEIACGVVDDFRERREPAQPCYYDSEFGRMARIVHRNLPTLTAVSEREFFVDDRPISTPLVNAAIQFHLERCKIWDYARNMQKEIDNRTITEVRGQLARRWPRLAASAESVEAGEIAMSVLLS